MAGTALSSTFARPVEIFMGELQSGTPCPYRGFVRKRRVHQVQAPRFSVYLMGCTVGPDEGGVTRRVPAPGNGCGLPMGDERRTQSQTTRVLMGDEPTSGSGIQRVDEDGSGFTPGSTPPYPPLVRWIVSCSGVRVRLFTHTLLPKSQPALTGFAFPLCSETGGV